MANPFKYRADHAGSLVVPADLRMAREQHAGGDIDDATLAAAEDSAIDAALKMQSESGVDVKSDGGFRRREIMSPHELTAIAGTEAEYLGKHCRSAYKVPLVLPGAWQAGGADVDGLVAVVREQLEALITAGVPYIQLVNPKYGTLLGDAQAPDMLDAALAADTAVLDGLERPDEVVIGLQIELDEGQAWFRAEGCDAAAKRLFAALPVDRFNVVYGADACANDFNPLRFVPQDRVVSLGLIRSDNPELEDADWVMDRLDEADAVFAQENLAVSVQPGFAFQNACDETMQQKKLHLAGVVARRYWGFEM